MGLILKNPLKNSLLFNKLSLKRNNIEVIKNAVDNINAISLRENITDYKLYDYVYNETKDIQDRFFLIDYYNFGLLDEDEYWERRTEVSGRLYSYFTETPFGEEFLKLKIRSDSDTEEKIELLNYLFRVCFYKNKINEFNTLLDIVEVSDDRMKKYIEKTKLDVKDGGQRRFSGY